MEYRELGTTGLRLSALAFGSWITFGAQLDSGVARECLSLAYERGVNFFDCAEVYQAGEAERIMGDALRTLAWPRGRYVVSTKYYFGIDDAVNCSRTLNRKYLLGAIDGSLRRLGLDFVDIVFCHRADPTTRVEEVVWAMDDMVSSGKALYWGTSHWPTSAIRAACQVADRCCLRRPVTEQAIYNLIARRRVEEEYVPLCSELGIGLTSWSPLASGLLSGKYRDGVPSGTRATLSGHEHLSSQLQEPHLNAALDSLRPLASDLGCTLAQLAIAWCLRNPSVNSIILGASRPEQLLENLDAANVVARLEGAVADLLESRAEVLREP